MNRIVPEKSNPNNQLPSWIKPEELIQAGRTSQPNQITKEASVDQIVTSYACSSCGKIVNASSDIIKSQMTTQKYAGKSTFDFSCPKCSGILSPYKTVGQVSSIDNAYASQVEVKRDLEKESSTYNTYVDRHLVYKAIDSLQNYAHKMGMFGARVRYLNSEHTKQAGQAYPMLNNINCEIEWMYGRNQKAKVEASIEIDQAGKYKFPRVFKFGSVEYPFEKESVQKMQKEVRFDQLGTPPQKSSTPTFKKPDVSRFRQASLNKQAEEDFVTEGTNSNGTSFRKNKKGQFHSLYSPAIEHSNGDKVWLQNGNIHRLDGPAIENSDGYKAWIYEDKLYGDTKNGYSQEQFEKDLKFENEKYKNQYSTDSTNQYSEDSTDSTNQYSEDSKASIYERTKGRIIVELNGNYWTMLSSSTAADKWVRESYGSIEEFTNETGIDIYDYVGKWFDTEFGSPNKEELSLINECLNRGKKSSLRKKAYTNNAVPVQRDISQFIQGQKVDALGKPYNIKTVTPGQGVTLSDPQTGQETVMSEENAKYLQPTASMQAVNDIVYGIKKKADGKDFVREFTDPFGNIARENDRGQFHSLSGPAVESTSGNKSWWVNGKFYGNSEEGYTQEQFERDIAKKRRSVTTKDDYEVSPGFYEDDEGYVKFTTREGFQEWLDASGFETEETLKEDTGFGYDDLRNGWFIVQHNRIYDKNSSLKKKADQRDYNKIQSLVDSNLDSKVTKYGPSIRIKSLETAFENSGLFYPGMTDEEYASAMFNFIYTDSSGKLNPEIINELHKPRSDYRERSEEETNKYRNELGDYLDSIRRSSLKKKADIGYNPQKPQKDETGHDKYHNIPFSEDRDINIGVDEFPVDEKRETSSGHPSDPSKQKGYRIPFKEMDKNQVKNRERFNNQDLLHLRSTPVRELDIYKKELEKEAVLNLVGLKKKAETIEDDYEVSPGFYEDDEGYVKFTTREGFQEWLDFSGFETEETLKEETGFGYDDLRNGWFIVQHNRIYDKESSLKKKADDDLEDYEQDVTYKDYKKAPPGFPEPPTIEKSQGGVSEMITKFKNLQEDIKTLQASIDEKKKPFLEEQKKFQERMNTSLSPLTEDLKSQQNLLQKYFGRLWKRLDDAKDKIVWYENSIIGNWEQSKVETKPASLAEILKKAEEVEPELVQSIEKIKALIENERTNNIISKVLVEYPVSKVQEPKLKASMDEEFASWFDEATDALDSLEDVLLNM